MKLRTRRPAFTLFHLLVTLAVLLILLGLLLPAVQKARQAATRNQSINNLRQLGIALHTHQDATGAMPPGVDANHFSTTTYLLPYIEQNGVYMKIDLKKDIDDRANKAARAVRIKLLESKQDPVEQVKEEWGATNYLYNHEVFFLGSKAKVPASFPDGSSNTLMMGETLKGDGTSSAVDVRRQLVLLGKDDLKGLKDDAGVKPFKADKNISGDRCASWMDGRFLQGTFNARLAPNDPRPDVSCAGVGGVSALRTLESRVNVLMADASARGVSVNVSHKTWKAAGSPAGGEVLGPDW